MQASVRAAALVAALAANQSGCNRDMASQPVPAPATQHVDLSGRQAGQSASLYTVPVYDPAADPAENLIATLAQASGARKRIILEIGGQW